MVRRYCRIAVVTWVTFIVITCVLPRFRQDSYDPVRLAHDVQSKGVRVVDFRIRLAEFDCDVSNMMEWTTRHVFRHKKHGFGPPGFGWRLASATVWAGMVALAVAALLAAWRVIREATLEIRVLRLARRFEDTRQGGDSW
jgi:hypothetical protein